MYIFPWICLFSIYLVNVEALSLHSPFHLKSKPFICGKLQKPIQIFSSVEDVNIPSLQPTSSFLQKASHGTKVLYKFSRPHTIKVTCLHSTIWFYFSENISRVSKNRELFLHLLWVWCVLCLRIHRNWVRHSSLVQFLDWLLFYVETRLLLE